MKACFEILIQQNRNNRLFSKFVETQLSQLDKKSGKQCTSCRSMCLNKVIPVAETSMPVFFILIDNLRFDQWKVIELNHQ